MGKRDQRHEPTNSENRWTDKDREGGVAAQARSGGDDRALGSAGRAPHESDEDLRRNREEMMETHR